MKIVLGQLFIADMMFYTNRLANSAEDGAKLGGSANWDKAAMNTAVEGMKLIIKNADEEEETEIQDEPKSLFCKPQSEAKIASITMDLVKALNPTESSAADIEKNLPKQLEPLVDLLWNEECNVYLLESNVS